MSQLFATPWTVAHQASLSMGILRVRILEHGLPCFPPGNLSYPGIKPRSPTQKVDSLTSEPPGKLIPLNQFSSVTQSCSTLCDPMDCSTPGFPVHHQLRELAQTHVHWVGDAIQPSYPLLSPSPAAFIINVGHYARLQSASTELWCFKKISCPYFSIQKVSPLNTAHHPCPN